MNIIPEIDLADILINVEKPGQYVGGEFGCIKKDASFIVAVSYPDLYEIGMSNLAVKLLYARLNTIPDVRCERVFAPKHDFLEALKNKNIPLYTLESGLPLSECDVIAFSIGYELNATNVLSILESGHVPYRKEERGGDHPVVIAGGPGITNPVPFSAFFDAVYMGEADVWLAEAFSKLAQLKKKNVSKQDLLAMLTEYPAMWTPEKAFEKMPENIQDKPKTIRSVWTDFGDAPFNKGYPIPSLKAAQDHGVVEIMRGCPNGCRFCNAGFIYRPFRAKSISCIYEEIYYNVFNRGYREISLSSLSTGDYPYIETLIRVLNRDYQHMKVSFSLPSLRIDTLALSLFGEIKTVRKSGLTFAIETSDDAAQNSINKIVSIEKTIALLKEAKKLGWKQAKFYFMLGLPGFIEKDEIEQITSCLYEIQAKTKIHINVNFSTFVPKPHTPLQWSAQLPEEEARQRLFALQRALPKRSFKVTWHSPFQSFLEGMIGRGDKRAGDIIEGAYRAGALFDAWDEYNDREIWTKIIENADWDVRKETYRKRDVTETLPWQDISFGVSQKTLKNEYEKVSRQELSPVCTDSCSHNCGVCSQKIKIKMNSESEEDINPEMVQSIKETQSLLEKDETFRILFTFAKKGKAVYFSHLNVMKIFEQALLRAGFHCRMTQGYNPKPILEFAHPLSLGIASENETAVVNLYNFTTGDDYTVKMNKVLPEGFFINRAQKIHPPQTGEKKYSLMSCYWGADYEIRFNEAVPDITPLKEFDNIVKVDFKETEKTLLIRVRDDENKNTSLKSILKAIYQTDNYFIHCSICRMHLLSKMKHHADIQSYFDTFPEINE